MTATQTQGLLAADRAQSWWLLSRLFLERPESGLLQDLMADLTDVPDGSGLDREVQALRQCLEGEESQTLQQQLMVEYTRLFRGIKEGFGPPPPFESLYRGEGLMSNTAQSARAHYLEAGFGEIVPEAGPQDHLGAELRFLSLLCYREAEGWQAGDPDQALTRRDAQMRFLEQHLMGWLPDYVRRIGVENQQPFYRAVVDLTLAFAKQVEADLEDELDAIQVA